MENEDSVINLETPFKQLPSSLLSRQLRTGDDSTRSGGVINKEPSVKKAQDGNISLRKIVRESKENSKKDSDSCTAKQPTFEEERFIGRLRELTDSSGGLKNEVVVLTLVMIMRDEKRPLIQSHLLDIILLSSITIHKKLVEANLFLGILHDWFNKSMTKKMETEVLLKILRVLRKLPMTKEDIREIRLKVRKLSTSSSDARVKEEATSLFEHWEKKRKGVSTVERSQAGVKLARVDSWSKQKVGKAMVATDPNVKKLKFKTSRRRSGPLSASEILEKRGRKELADALDTLRRQTRQNSAAEVGQEDLMTQAARNSLLDRIPAEAAKVIQDHRDCKKMEKYMESAPTRLVHEMEVAPHENAFYVHQRSLLEEHKKKLQQGAPEQGNCMQAHIKWSELAAIETPSGDVYRVPLQSQEMKIEMQREKNVPPSNSYEINIATEVSAPTSKTHVAALIPFEAEDPNQREKHSEVLLAAGVRHPELVKALPLETDSVHTSEINDVENSSAEQKCTTQEISQQGLFPVFASEVQEQEVHDEVALP